MRAVNIFIRLLNNEENKKIEEEKIIEFTYELLFSKEKEVNNIKFDNDIMDFFIDKLKGIEIDDNEEDRKYFFSESKALSKFMVLMLAASVINLHMCVIGPPGGGKTTSAKAFSRIRGQLLNIDIPFKIQTFSEGTKPHNFYGTSTLIKSKVKHNNGNNENSISIKSEIKFKPGTLTEAMLCGSVFIADEFNLCETSTMKSISPALEFFFNEKLIIPGIEEPCIIHNYFFFVICQNDSNILGRNQIPPEIESKLRTIYYPEPELNEIKLICKNINKDLNEEKNINDNKRLSDEDAEKCGEFMIELNKKPQRILSKWSLRDINKLFLRLINIRKNDHIYENIDTKICLLFYTMSPVSNDNKQRILEDVIILIVNIFERNKDEQYKKTQKKLLKDIYESRPCLEYKKGKGVFIRKGKCSILFKRIDENLSKYENSFKIYDRLPSFLNSLFKVFLSNIDEPILLSGNTCYKTFLAEEYLSHEASVVTLNQETSIEQLLGSSQFFDKNEVTILHYYHY